jgi:hypothetical protein
MEFVNRSQAKKLTKISYLGNVNSSAKIKKSTEKDNVLTYVLYLSPFNKSGFNVCPFATDECIEGCLDTSGRVKMDVKDVIQNARVNKTRLLFNERSFFNDWLFAEIAAAKKKAEKLGLPFAVRLNGTSDLALTMFKKDNKYILEYFSDVTFYDYTKVPNRINLQNKYNNYHLTFSYSGRNWNDCTTYLNNGSNVAIVFNVKKGQPLPATYKGYKVIDGDLSDYRPNDEKGCIVGLRWKMIKDKTANEKVSKSIFVIQKDNKDLTW